MRETVKYGERGQGSLTRAGEGETWYSILSVNGKQMEFSTKTADLKEARTFHKGKLEELVLAKHGKAEFQTPALSRLLFGTLLDDRIQDYQLNGGKSLWSFLAHARPVRAHFGTWRAIDIKKRDIDVYVLKRLRGGKARGQGQLTAGGINRELGVISSTLRLAVTNELLPKMPAIKRLPENNIRKGFFTRAEVEQIIALLPDYLRDFTRFGFVGGWRFSEITGLRWADVDMAAGLV
ncbi:MAG: hypothetical protein L0170_05455, partial [Acidobacteria bacterium]|nr:hypothetical protein [Acidobacteriota bacterium]